MSWSPAATALALLDVPGIGRVTAHRILAHFESMNALRATPREQIFLRIRRSPKAADLVERLLDADAMDALLDTAETLVKANAERGIFVLTDRHPDWPASFKALADTDRPVVLFAYGNTAALGSVTLSLLARPPVPGAAFELAQGLARDVLAQRQGIVIGAAHGFDLALSKLAADARVPSVAVLSCGLAKLTPSFRPAATALVRAGGLLVSPFVMDHGPFDHDDDERATIHAFLSRRAVGVSVAPDSPEARALSKAQTAPNGPRIGAIGESDAPFANAAVLLDTDFHAFLQDA